jgi:hypothetical protein
MGVRALSEASTAQQFDPDAELVEAARLDPRAFLGLYDRYAERVLGYVKLRIADRDACEDVTSQIFTRALERIDQFGGQPARLRRNLRSHRRESGCAPRPDAPPARAPTTEVSR